MVRTSTPRLGTFLALATALVFATGCGDDNGTGPGNTDPVVATWQVSSFSDGTTDFITAGMSMKITLSSSDTYSFMVTNDQVGTCSGNIGSNCTSNGPYTHTSSQLTIDSGTQDAVTFNYTINGSTMTWTGTIDTTPVTITMTKTS